MWGVLAASLIFSQSIGYPATRFNVDLPEGGVVLVTHRHEATPPALLTDSSGRVYFPVHVWEPVEVGENTHGALAFSVAATSELFVTVPGLGAHPTGVDVSVFGPVGSPEFRPVMTGHSAHISFDTPGRAYRAALSAYGGHVHIHGGRGGHNHRQLSTGAYTRFSGAAQAGHDRGEFTVVKRHADGTSVYTYGRTERNAPEFVDVDWVVFIVVGD